MDYSPHDPENFEGTSPWASSPQRQRSSFGPPTGEIPSSPLPARSPYAEDDLTGGGFHSEHAAPAEPGTPRKLPQNGEADQAEHETTHSKSPQQHSTQQQQEPPHSPGQAPPHSPGQQRYHGTRARQSKSQDKLQAKVTGLERNGKKDPILRFDVYTNILKFRTTQYRDVRRLHSEFVKLGEHLISANPEAFVPAVPPPSTAAGVGTDEDEARVKASIQRWLNTVCSNEVLIQDEEMVFFVESDFGYSPVVRRKQPATGVRRKMIKQFAPPPDDTPELAEARPVVKMFYLGTMDTGQKLDKVVKTRRSLGLAEADMGVKLGQMQVQETHSGLAGAYKKLGKVIQAVGDYHAAQGTAEATTLSDPLQYHSSDAFIVKETLTNRHILMRELAQAKATTLSKLSAADRLKASTSVRRDKADEAIAALDDARAHEDHLAKKCARVTQNLVLERRRWFARTAADMRAALREYVVRQIEAERRTLATLEQIRPDIRSIDGTGGLSRLGRESHPSVRRSSLASSQGPKGDAWSGVPRRADGLNRTATGLGATRLPEDDEEEEGAKLTGRKRAVSGAGSLKGVQEEDDDRVDAKNAASRLATTSF